MHFPAVFDGRKNSQITCHILSLVCDGDLKPASLCHTKTAGRKFLWIHLWNAQKIFQLCPAHAKHGDSRRIRAQAHSNLELFRKPCGLVNSWSFPHIYRGPILEPHSIFLVCWWPTSSLPLPSNPSSMHESKCCSSSSCSWNLWVFANQPAPAANKPTHQKQGLMKSLLNHWLPWIKAQ